MSPSVDVRYLLADEVDRYRQLRLRSLLDSPTAFTATWEQESTMPQSDWKGRVESSVAGQSAIVVADTGDELVGVASGIPWAAERVSSACGSRRIGEVVDWPNAS